MLRLLLLLLVFAAAASVDGALLLLLLLLLLLSATVRNCECPQLRRLLLPTLRFSFSIKCEFQPLRPLLHQEQHSAFPHQSLRDCGVRSEERRNASGRAESIPLHGGTRGGSGRVTSQPQRWIAALAPQ